MFRIQWMCISISMITWNSKLSFDVEIDEYDIARRFLSIFQKFEDFDLSSLVHIQNVIEIETQNLIIGVDFNWYLKLDLSWLESKSLIEACCLESKVWIWLIGWKSHSQNWTFGIDMLNFKLLSQSGFRI